MTRFASTVTPSIRAPSVEAWTGERERRGGAPIRVGIGAHYGPVVIGDIGDSQRLERAVLGDTVNVASRLERASRDLGCTVVVSEDLVAAAKRPSSSCSRRRGPRRRLNRSAVASSPPITGG